MRFKQWSRKGYAAFKSVGRHVTIGALKSIVADRLLGKQPALVSVCTDENSLDSGPEKNTDPPEGILNLFTQLCTATVLRASINGGGACMAVAIKK